MGCTIYVIVAILIVLVLVSASIGVYMYMRSRHTEDDKKEKPDEKSKPVSIPVDHTASTPIPEPEPETAPSADAHITPSADESFSMYEGALPAWLARHNMRQQVRNISSVNPAVPLEIADHIPYDENVRFQTPTCHTPSVNPQIGNHIRA
jgi:hypothetical protein